MPDASHLIRMRSMVAAGGRSRHPQPAMGAYVGAISAVDAFGHPEMATEIAGRIAKIVLGLDGMPFGRASEAPTAPRPRCRAAQLTGPAQLITARGL
jgi:hypothetical protein